MPTKNSDKNKDVIKDLEKTISPILVVNNSTLKPYVELFEYQPENIYQQPLGSLVGFFEVKEFSEESAYIVNFLTSVLKKEYYINPKRPVTESLDSALHKVNMALSELAKHGNVEWLGKINAAICVLEKNNTHFSVSGDAKIFLYRKQILSEISEGLASDSIDPHPLKTFVNVSSGRLEKDDRLLITAADIFQILSASEIKKGFQRFEGEKFVQFLRTALSNQMEMIVSIVVEMMETEPAPVAKTLPRKKTAKALNAFSQQSFATTPSLDTLADQPDIILDNEIQTEPDYTDEKTGHIYVQGEAIETNENSHAQISLYWDMVKEKVSQGSYVTKNEIRKRFSLYKKQLAKKRELRKIARQQQEELLAQENKRLEEERVLGEILKEQELKQQQEKMQQIRLEQQLEREEERKRTQLEQAEQEEKEFQVKAAATKKKLKSVIVIEKEIKSEKEVHEEDTFALGPQASFLEKLRLAQLEQQQKQQHAAIDLSLKNKALKQEPENETEFPDELATDSESKEESPSADKIKDFAKKYVSQASMLAKRSIVLAKTALTKTKRADTENRLDVVPHFSKIKELFSRFSNKQKLYTFGALFLIFIVPIFIVRFWNQTAKPAPIEIEATIPTQAEILANEKNMKSNIEAKTVFSDKNIIATLMADDDQIAVTKTGLTILQNNEPKTFPLPADSGNPVRAAYMDDLSLVLVLTDSNKIISFSPISTKFADNKIELAGISPTSFIGTYLTYMYMLDQKNNQIYRFPRADGGFGEKTNWLKEETSLAAATDMAIDDNIYIIQGNHVIKLFKGKSVQFATENSSTPIQFDNIHTTPNLAAIYVLDKENSRIIKYSKEGSIVAQFHSEKLKEGISLSVDEKNSIAYLATSDGLISISLQ